MRKRTNTVKNRHLPRLAGMLLALLIASGCTAVPSLDAILPTGPTISETTRLRGEHTTVVRIIDGDTLAVQPTDALPATNDAGTEHVVRLLGIDTPELNGQGEEPAECGAQEATAHMAEIAPVGEGVLVVHDKVSDTTDRYGRSLAYVTTQLGGMDVGKAMVSDGYASAWYPRGEQAPSRYEIYLNAQTGASHDDRGLHPLCPTIGRTP